MFNKNKDNRKYYYAGDESLLAAPQKNRLIALGVSLAAFIIPPLIIAQQANAKLLETKQHAILAGYLILVVFTAMLGVYCLISALTHARLGKPVPIKAAPRVGWDKRTFLSVEWYARLAVACTLAKVGLLIYAFSWWSLALAAFSAGAATGAVFFRRITFEAYKTDGVMELKEPENAVTEEPEQAKETDDEESKPEPPAEKTNLPKLKRSDEDTEDFYDRD